MGMRRSNSARPSAHDVPQAQSCTRATYPPTNAGRRRGDESATARALGSRATTPFPKGRPTHLPFLDVLVRRRRPTAAIRVTPPEVPLTLAASRRYSHLQPDPPT